MSIETALPFSWLKTAPDIIKTVDEIPLWGNPPPFPFDVYSTELANALQIPRLKASCANIEWIVNDKLLVGFGENPWIHAFSIAPLQGQAFWIFPKEASKRLYEELVHHQQEEEWSREFYQFLLLQAVHAFYKTPFDTSLSPQLLTEVTLPTAPCLCLDIDFSTDTGTYRGRLAISSEMRASIKQKYTTSTLNLPTKISEAVTATLHVTIGSVSLSKKEWNGAALGDFLILDSCTYVPGDEKGRVVLTLNNTPLFRAKIKDQGLKLLEYPLLQEVKTPMEKQEDQEFDDTFDTEDTTLSEAEGEAHSLEEEEEDLFEEHPLSESSSEKPQKPLINLEEIPLTISIEIARIQVSIQQLMQLSPGNMLDLEIIPENGVDLVVNGHCVAKGELLKLGETLGVRILDKA